MRQRCQGLWLEKLVPVVVLQYIPLYVFGLGLTHEIFDVQLFFRPAQNKSPKKWTKPSITCSVFFWAAIPSSLTSWCSKHRGDCLISFGPQLLVYVPFFLPHPPSLRNIVMAFGSFPYRFNMFWRNWRCWNGLVLHCSFVDWGHCILQHWHREWPNGILVRLTRCPLFAEDLSNYFSMFSTTRISAWSHSHWNSDVWD